MKKLEARKQARMILSEILLRFMTPGWEWQFSEHLGRGQKGALSGFDDDEAREIINQMETQSMKLLKHLTRGWK